MVVNKVISPTDLDNKTIRVNSNNKVEAVYTTNTLIGPGRPDKPATTNGVITGKEVDGMVYQSSDGAGVGANLWQKKNGKWIVISGDTGEVVLPHKNLKGKSFIKLRRQNNQVFISFGGIGWGLFGILGTDEEGYDSPKSWPPRTHITEFHAIPKGFQSATTQMGTFYKGDLAKGSVVVTGRTDSNYIRVTPSDGKLEKVGSEDYKATVPPWLTEDAWPDKL